MNVKKQVIENIKHYLLRKKDDINMKLRSNIRKLKALEKEQRVLKRERAQYWQLLRGLQ